MTMSAAPIVEDLDVIENIGTGEISCFVDALADTFFFQTAEKVEHVCLYRAAKMAETAHWKHPYLEAFCR